MVKSKRVAKKANDAIVEAENPVDTNNEEAEKSQENGIEEEASVKKAAKGKNREKKEKPAAEPARKSSRAPKPLTKEGDSETTYEVEKIIDFRVYYGKPQYLVRWKGYTKGDDTWEEEIDLNCPDLLQKFKSENSTEKKGKKRPSKSPVKSPAKKTKKVEEDYEVEEVVGFRVKNGKREFKIRWKGYKESDDSWEPEKHLSCQDLIEKYLKEHKDEVEAEEEKKPAKKAIKKTKKPAAKSPKKAKRK